MAAGTRGRSIFLSYRRDDSEGEAGRLFDDLVRAYGDDSVFMDVTGIEPGLDFRKAIDDNVAGCGVLLAIIGPTWATVTGSDGTRRLDNPNDFVRLEIGSALKRGTPVIPVLVHEARMPALDQLPDDLKDLRYRNSVELTHARWNSDVALLVAALKNYVTGQPANPADPVHANVPVQLPAPQPSAPNPAAAPAKSRTSLWIGLAALVAVAAAGSYFLLRGNGSSPQSQTATPTTVSATTATAPAAVAPPKDVAMPSTERALLGRWKNANPPDGRDDLTQLTVADFGGQLMVEAWGQCAKRLCAWGTRKATLSGDSVVTGAWQLRNTPQENKQLRSAELSLTVSGSNLQVTVKNAYQNPARGGRQFLNQLGFVKAD
jgi:hypothetical protein